MSVRAAPHRAICETRGSVVEPALAERVDLGILVESAAAGLGDRVFGVCRRRRGGHLGLCDLGRLAVVEEDRVGASPVSADESALDLSRAGRRVP